MPLEYGRHDQCFSKGVPYNTSCAWYEAGINDGTILEDDNPEIQNCNCQTLFFALGNLGCAKGEPNHMHTKACKGMHVRARGK